MTKKRPLTTEQENIQPGVLLLLQVPRGGEHGQDAMVQLLESLHELLRLPLIKILRTYKRERVSLEITASGGNIGFYIWAPKYLKSHLVEYIHMHFPLIAITEADDQLPTHAQQFASTYVVEFLPGETATDDAVLKKVVDALAGLRAEEAASLQLLIRPAKSDEKSFDTQLRAVYHSNLPQSEAMLRMQGIIAPYGPAGHTHVRTLTADEPALVFCVGREFAPDHQVKNASTVSQLYHLSHGAIAHPKILWLKPQRAQPPEFLLFGTDNDTTNELSPIGSVQVRGSSTMFGLRRADRNRHVVAYGDQGVGKTSLLELLAISDIYSRHGLAVIDTEGALVGGLLARVPYERAGEVVYIDFTDKEYPPAFNPLELHDPQLKLRAIHELVIALRHIFDEVQPATEALLRQVLSVLIDAPEATLLDMPRFLRDKTYRSQQLVHTSDVAARSFWQTDFASWSAKNEQGDRATKDIVQAVQRLVDDPQIANILGQPKTSFSLPRIMQQGGILLVHCGDKQNTSTGLLASLLGVSLHMVTLSRANIQVQQRQPFYVYQDEVYSCNQDEWQAKLHEARRYAVGYVLAATATKAQAGILDVVGTKLCFRVTKANATLAKMLGPDVMHYDIMTLANRQFVASVDVDGKHMAAFAAISLTLPEHGEDLTKAITEYCRGRYNSSKTFVENYLRSRYSTYIATPEPAPKPRIVKKISSSPVAAAAARSLPSAKKHAPNALADSSSPKKRKTIRRRKKPSQLEHGILRDMELMEKPNAKGK